MWLLGFEFRTLEEQSVLLTAGLSLQPPWVGFFLVAWHVSLPQGYRFGLHTPTYSLPLNTFQPGSHWSRDLPARPFTPMRGPHFQFPLQLPLTRLLLRPQGLSSCCLAEDRLCCLPGIYQLCAHPHPYSPSPTACYRNFHRASVEG